MTRYLFNRKAGDKSPVKRANARRALHRIEAELNALIDAGPPETVRSRAAIDEGQTECRHRMHVMFSRLYYLWDL